MVVSRHHRMAANAPAHFPIDGHADAPPDTLGVARRAQAFLERGQLVIHCAGQPPGEFSPEAFAPLRLGDQGIGRLMQGGLGAWSKH